jgi:hypothetical protein
MVEIKMGRSYLRLASKLTDIDKPDLKKQRHKVSKKDLEEYYEKEGIEELGEEEE